MSSSDIMLSVRGVSKAYSIAHNAPRHTSMGEALMHRLRNPIQKIERETFWALCDVSFEVARGEVVGVIGRNGAGKSTLLKVLSQITGPTRGEIDLYGRVGSLLEVGTGFHPELTGRENVFLNGAILGMRRRDIEREFDAIVQFAGVERFLDTPVKRYSSGMYVRLAFAVAAHLDTEILIVDEVLSVGDGEFQKKCLGKMQDVADSGRTVIFVSHQLEAVATLCTQCIVLQEGRVKHMGDVGTGIQEYVTSLKCGSVEDQRQSRSGSGEVRFTSVGPEKEFFEPGEEKVINFTAERIKPSVDSYFGGYFIGCLVVNEDMLTVLHLDSRLTGPYIEIEDRYDGRIVIKSPWLKPGDYRIDLFIFNNGMIDQFEGACHLSVLPVLPYPVAADGLAGTYGTVFADFEFTKETASVGPN